MKACKNNLLVKIMEMNSAIKYPVLNTYYKITYILTDNLNAINILCVPKQNCNNHLLIVNMVF